LYLQKPFFSNFEHFCRIIIVSLQPLTHSVHTYASNDRFIPAGTPVIIRSNKSGNVKMTIPTTEPSAVITECVFSGNYLEQKLAAGNEVYTFGLPFTS